MDNKITITIRAMGERGTEAAFSPRFLHTDIRFFALGEDEVPALPENATYDEVGEWAKEMFRRQEAAACHLLNVPAEMARFEWEAPGLVHVSDPEPADWREQEPGPDMAERERRIDDLLTSIKSRRQAVA